jgi:hypothetical protein
MTLLVDDNCEEAEKKNWESERLNLESELNNKKDEIEKEGISDKDIKEGKRNIATLSNRFMYQKLVKLHSTDGLYKVLGQHLSKGLYQEAAMYIKILMINVRDFGFRFHYNAINTPVYIGFEPNSVTFKREDYL